MEMTFAANALNCSRWGGGEENLGENKAAFTGTVLITDNTLCQEGLCFTSLNTPPEPRLKRHSMR